MIFGTAVDELVRHHPTLKDKVFGALGGIFEEMEGLAKGQVEEGEGESLYRLVMAKSGDEGQEQEQEAGMEVEGTGTGTGTGTEQARTEGSATPEAILEPEQTKQEPTDNLIVAFVDVICRVCPSFLANHKLN